MHNANLKKHEPRQGNPRSPYSCYCSKPQQRDTTGVWEDDDEEEEEGVHAHVPRILTDTHRSGSSPVPVELAHPGRDPPSLVAPIARVLADSAVVIAPRGASDVSVEWRLQSRASSH